MTVTCIDSAGLPVPSSGAIFPENTREVAMSKLSVVLLGATLSLYAVGSFAAVPVSSLSQAVQHAQSTTVKSEATKATKKHAKKKAVRKAKKKAVSTLVK